MKLLGTYPLPWWGLQVSGTFQSQVPDPVGGANFDYNYFGLPANYVAGNAQIGPSLGRNLSSGGNVTVNVVEPGTLYPGRTNQFDAARWPRPSRLADAAAAGLLDLYNVFNSNVALRLNGAYGSDGAAGARRRRSSRAAGQVRRAAEILTTNLRRTQSLVKEVDLRSHIRPSLGGAFRGTALNGSRSSSALRRHPR